MHCNYNTFINLNVISIMTCIAGVSLRDYFLCFEQQQRGSARWHALSLINHGPRELPIKYLLALMWYK